MSYLNYTGKKMKNWLLVFTQVQGKQLRRRQIICLSDSSITSQPAWCDHALINAGLHQQKVNKRDL